MSAQISTLDVSEPLRMLMNQTDGQRPTAATAHPLFASPILGVMHIQPKATLMLEVQRVAASLGFLCRQGLKDRLSHPFAHRTTFIAPLNDEN